MFEFGEEIFLLLKWNSDEKYDVDDVELCCWLGVDELMTKGMVIHAWERNLQSYISLEHIMFDHRSKWGNFCDLLGFNEVWCVLKYKIVFKA